jgi:hypothetical protein
MRVSVDQHGRINIYHTIPEIRILSKDQGPGDESQKAKMQMDPEPGKPQPKLNPEARRILEKILADETIPERQDLEGLKFRSANW